MKSPFFTVVIPTYNRAGMIKEAIQSVLEQTFADFELLAVDDYSTDTTREVVGSFADNRIKYILNDRAKGASGSRNAGIFRAKGEWVAFLDSDDTWLPDKLNLLRKKIGAIDPQTGLIYTGLANYDFNAGKEISLRIPQKEGWLQKELLYKNFIGTMSIVAIRTDILKQIGGCDEKLAFFEDGDLYARVAGVSKISCLPEKLTYYRSSNIDKFSYEHDKRLRGYQQFWEKHKEVINNDLWLRHRAASRVFELAVIQGKLREGYQAMPWTMAGLFLDFKNLVRMVKNILIALYIHKRT